MKPLRQCIPTILTVITCAILIIILATFISVLNLFPLSEKIILQLRFSDILIGFTIYVKTSVDFALFIGNLMSKNPGMKNRVAIETGTALGNAAGTLFVLLVWTFFKEVPLLMVLMVLLASLVLFSMAEEGIEVFVAQTHNVFTQKLLSLLKQINTIFAPLISRILPQATNASISRTTFLSLLFFAFTIPLILGLDDFAGYIPLFNIVNVFGFAAGVFLGHMLLNIALFASPKHTIAIVKQPVIALLGSIAFIGIGLWGFVEIYHLIIKFF